MSGLNIGSRTLTGKPIVVSGVTRLQKIITSLVTAGALVGCSSRDPARAEETEGMPTTLECTFNPTQTAFKDNGGFETTDGRMGFAMGTIRCNHESIRNTAGAVKLKTGEVIDTVNLSIPPEVRVNPNGEVMAIIGNLVIAGESPRISAWTVPITVTNTATVGTKQVAAVNIEFTVEDNQ